MSFIAKNPLSLPEIRNTPSTPPGTRGLFAKEDGWYEIDSNGVVKKIGGVGETLEPDGAEIFNDYENNTTNVEYSHVEGYQGKGVVKAFHPQNYTQIDAGSGVVTLDSIEGITVGMHYNIFISANNTIERYRGVITEITAASNSVKLEGQSITAGMISITYPTPTTAVYNNLIIAGGTIGTFEVTEFDADSYEHGFSQHIEGSKAIAGISAHAEGIGTEALGFGSHAEGYYSKAYGERAHAEGYKTLADGNESHAEGLSCQATGEASHAEGSKSVASGDYAHAEGGGSIASGNRAHAEGQVAEASGDYSHAEGYYTIASGDYSHVEGKSTKAAGDSQHVQGRFNIEDTENKYAHILGNGWNENNRKNAHTIDWDGNAWFAGDVSINKKGRTTKLIDSEDLNDAITKVGEKGTGDKSVVFNGTSNKATNLQSFAQGDKCTASGEQAHAEGLQNTAKGNASHAEGFQTNAEGMVSHTEGWGTNTKAGYSHAEGRGTVANVMYQHVEGIFNKYEDEDGKALNYAHVVGNGSANNRSNAHTLDWNGNAWFAGRVTVGDNNESLVTESELMAVKSTLDNIDDKALTNVTDEGLQNITNKEFAIGEIREVAPEELKPGDIIIDFKALGWDSTGMINPGDEKELIITKDSATRLSLWFSEDPGNIDSNHVNVTSLPYTVGDMQFVGYSQYVVSEVFFIDPAYPNFEVCTNEIVSFIVCEGTDKIATKNDVIEYVETKIDDRDLTNVTDEGLTNITSKEFGGITVNQGQIITKGQTISNFEAYFVDDGTVGTKDDEYTDGAWNNEIILVDIKDSNNAVFLANYNLPYVCDKDYKFELAGFTRPNGGLHTENVVLVVDSSKIATTKEVEGKVGDIETALDNIIAIQNALIGGDSV